MDFYFLLSFLLLWNVQCATSDITTGTPISVIFTELENSQEVNIVLPEDIFDNIGYRELAIQIANHTLCDTLSKNGKTLPVKYLFINKQDKTRISGPNLSEIQLFLMCESLHLNDKSYLAIVSLFADYDTEELILMDKEANDILNKLENTKHEYSPSGNSIAGLILPLFSTKVATTNKQQLLSAIKAHDGFTSHFINKLNFD